jgi:hypothetical protein
MSLMVTSKQSPFCTTRLDASGSQKESFQPRCVNPWLSGGVAMGELDEPGGLIGATPSLTECGLIWYKSFDSQISQETDTASKSEGLVL